MDDQQIIGLFLTRDESAIKETETKYGKLCLRICQNILGNPEDAEECVQDTYLTVWNQIPPTQPHNFSAFLCRIARNLALKKLEYSSAAKRSAHMCIPLSEIEAFLPDCNISFNLEDEELGAVISAFLRNEKDVNRNVFLRRYWFFDSVSDIAKQYSFSENKVKSMLFRTRNRLRDYLIKEGITP